MKLPEAYLLELRKLKIIQAGILFGRPLNKNKIFIIQKLREKEMTITELKNCFDRDWSDKNQLIQISNFLKINTGGNDYVYEYKRGDKSILYYSKRGYGTYFFIEKDTPCYTGGEQLNSTDIDILERKFKITGLQNDAFKKVSITILN
jgi:hypothetical protein